jgi:WD40 repeat protein
MSDRPPLVEVLLRQREAWEKGSRPRVEELLELHPHLRDDPEAVLDLIYNEALLREEAGEAVRFEEYVSRFPHLGPALRAQLEVEEALAQGDLSAAPPAPLGTTVPAAAPAAPQPLPQLEGCDLLGELGRGAMGVVFRGWQRGARRPVAVKLLAADVPAGRVQAEIEAASRMQHPNVVQAFEVKQHEGRAALVLEYVEGGNLAQKLAGKPQPPADAARLVETLAWAMAYAHGRGVIHRDLKPSNVLLSAGPDEPLRLCVPKISDFGLAKLVEGPQGLTATTDVLGTPSYMAPEQAGGSAADVGPAADVWALGAILYECLTGRPPFLGQSVIDTLDQVRHQEPVPPSRLQPKTPRDLEIICLKCLDKSPARRYAGARELAEDLRHFQAGEPIRARAVGAPERAWKWARRRPATAALALVSLLVAVGLATGGLTVYRVLRGQRDLALRQKGELEARLLLERRLKYTAVLRSVGSVWESDPAQGLRMLEDASACPPDLRCFSWGVLHAQCRRYRRSVAEEAVVTALACDPRGKFLVAGTAAGQVLLRDRAGREVSRLEPHAGRVTALAFSKDGLLLASGGADGRVQLWEMPLGKPRGGFAVPAGPVAGLAWLPDGRALAVSAGKPAQAGQVSLWDAQGPRLRRVLPGETHPLSGVAVSPDGALVACGAPDHSVRLWDARTGGRRGQLRGHTAPVTCLVFAAAGRPLITGGLDGVVRLWDPGREGRLETFAVATGPVTGLALHPAGQVLAVAGAGPVDAGAEVVPDVQLWDLLARRGDEPLRGHPGGGTGVAFSADGKTLVTAGADRTLKLWDHPGRREQVTLRGHAPTPGSVALSADGRTLAWLGRGQEIHVLDLGTGALLNVFRGHGRPIQALALSPDGQRLASAAGHTGEPAELLVWEVRSGRLVQALSGHAGEVAALAFSPDGRELASAGRDGVVKLWDVEKGSPRRQLAAGIKPLAAVVFSGDGAWLAAGGGPAGGPGAVVVWDGVTGEPRRRLEAPDGVRCLAMPRDGGAAAYAGGGGVVYLERLRGEGGRESFAVGMKGVASVAFSPDGQTLAVAGSGTGVKLWDVPTVQERASLPRHRGGACFAGFAADGRLLVTASVTQSARLWHSLRPE